MMNKSLVRFIYSKLPQKLQKTSYNLYYYFPRPKVFIELIKKKIWFKKFQNFNLKNREVFFLKVTSFLWTNRKDELSNGYYMEFGCFGCKTMTMCWSHTRHLFNLEYLAFDSFEGLPDIAPIDKQPIWKKGRLSMSEEEFKKIIFKQGMPNSRLKTIKGFYEKSLNKKLALKFKKKATIIYIDCDLYKSTVPILKFIIPFLQKGTIIAFDDWNCFWGDKSKGQKKAWSEFCKKNRNLNFEPFFSDHHIMSYIFIGLK